MEKEEKGLFKVNKSNKDKFSTSKKGGGVITPAEPNPNEINSDDDDDDDMENFNEYNCVGASSSKGATGADNESAAEPK